MPEKIGDLVDRPALLDKLSRPTVAQKMGTSDATKLDPAMPQTLPHDPRQWRSVLDPPNGCGERQEQIRNIDPRPLVQNPAVGTTFQPNARVVLTNGLDFHVEERSYEAGFLDRPLPPLAKSPGVCRIAFIGDSMVEAAQVPIGQKVQVVIQKRLEAARPGKPVETMAFGFSGTGQVNKPDHDI